MKLNCLYEFKSLPQLDPLDLKKYGLKSSLQSNETQYNKEMPSRTGYGGIPTNPKHRGLMGVPPGQEHATKHDTQSRPNGTHRAMPLKFNSEFKDLGDPLDRELQNDVVEDELTDSKSGFSPKFLRLGENPGVERSNRAGTKNSMKLFGNRYTQQH